MADRRHAASGTSHRAVVPGGRLHRARKLWIWIPMLAAGVAAAPVQAGPPFVTDDPEPVDYRHWEINTAITKTWGRDGMSAGIPGVDINYGIVPDVQLHLQPRYSQQKRFGQSRYGVDDTEVGVKYRFFRLESGERSLQVATYPLLQLPTGNRNLGPDRRTLPVFLPLWVQGTADRLTVYGGAGYRINQGPDNRNSVFTGATALYQVSKDWQLGGELFHETRTTGAGASSTGFNLGGNHVLGASYNLLFSAGQTRQAIDGSQRSVYIGLQVLR